MSELLDLVDALWDGRAVAEDVNPMAPRGVLVEIAPETAFVSSFGNISGFRTDEGLVLVDTGSVWAGGGPLEQLRAWDDAPVHTAIFSHGHVDHVTGITRIEQQQPEPVRVVGHEAMPARFDRYVRTAGWNAAINMRQFGVESGLAWPTDYRYPDLTYRDEMSLAIGGETFELRHARGETDDHTWTWIPSRKVLCSGDLFIWATPNAGNPQKVQRYPAEWAQALRVMAALGAEVLLPGHGLPVTGADRIRVALQDTASLLESLHDQTLVLMNEGATLDRILHTVEAPAELLAKPYLRPIYDEPEFIVRSVWRLYGGWWDGDPASLKPAPSEAVAREVAALAGGVAALVERARALAAAGDRRLATHLAGWAIAAASDDEASRRAAAEILEGRAQAETSLMAKGVFGTAARQARQGGAV